MKREIIDPKVFVHTSIHFFGVWLFYIAAILFPLWAAILFIIAHQIHMKLLGRCVLTKLAYHYGVMVGFTYWEYVSYLFGAKDYKRAGLYVDRFIKVTVMGILLSRITLSIISFAGQTLG